MDKLKKQVKLIDQNKKDNFKKSVSFFKEMGQKDIDFMTALHESMVDNIKNSEPTNLAVFDIFDDIREADLKEQFLDEEDIFDN